MLKIKRVAIILASACLLTGCTSEYTVKGLDGSTIHSENKDGVKKKTYTDKNGKTYDISGDKSDSSKKSDGEHTYYGVNGKAPVYSNNGINVYRLGYSKDYDETFIEIENTNPKAYEVNIDFAHSGSDLMYIKVPHNGMVLEPLTGVNLKDFTVTEDTSEPYEPYDGDKFLDIPLDKVFQIGKVSIQLSKDMNTVCLASIPVKNISSQDIAVSANIYGVFLDENGNILGIDMFSAGDVDFGKTLTKDGTGTIV